MKNKLSIKKVFILGVCLFVVCYFLYINITSKNRLSKESEYMIIHSKMLEQSNGIYCINSQGEITQQIDKSNMQDLTHFAFNNDMLLISGARANNNLIFNLSQNGLFSELNLLNEPQYSGVTAVELRDKTILAVMNGNYSDKTYLNLIVEQNFQGDIIQKNIVEIYAKDISIVNDIAIISGKYLYTDIERTWQASLVEYDLKQKKIIEQYKYDNYNCFWDSFETDQIIYCLAEDKNEYINTICSIDKKTYAISNEYKINDQLNSIYNINDQVFVIGNNGCYLVSSDLTSSTMIIKFDSIENGYVYWAYPYNEYYYIFYRYQERILNNNEYKYGELYKLDLTTRQIIATPIIQDKRIAMDNILVFPTPMFLQKNSYNKN